MWYFVFWKTSTFISENNYIIHNTDFKEKKKKQNTVLAVK